MAPPRVEVVHVGSACRDIAPDDPRGWRLGGGVTYASLTTARLGLRTAAIVGVDATAATASELDLLREAGVDLLLVPLDEGPIFHNQETPTGRVQTCVQVGVPLPVPALPESWLAAPGWSIVPVAGEVVDAWAAIVPDAAHLAVAWQGFLRTLVPGERVTRRPPTSVAHRRTRRPGRRQPSRCPPGDASRGAVRPAPSRRGPARHAGRPGRAAGPRRQRRTDRDAALQIAERYLAQSKPRKLHIGCGQNQLSRAVFGWVNSKFYGCGIPKCGGLR